VPICGGSSAKLTQRASDSIVKCRVPIEPGNHDNELQPARFRV
jgi:hypothetical protein